ncbi:hypothetical protein WA588_002943 [Blastocystis sp. NMH]
MAHGLQQKAGIDMKEGDLVSILNDGQYYRDLGVITKLGKVMVTVFFLSGQAKTEMKEVWAKTIRFIARGFDIDTYYHLKEYKLSLEYTSLYTYINKSLIPAAFQEEIGIPKLVYEIGDVFPFVASISHKYTPDKRCHDDSVLNLPYDSSSSFRKKSESSDDLHSRGYSTSPIPLDPKPNLFQNTKERFVQMWLNINERVSPSRKKLKEETREIYVPPTPTDSGEELNWTFGEDSTHYTQFISGNRKSELFRYLKTNRKACPQNHMLMYSRSGVRHLPPIPLQSDLESPRGKRVCFSVKVVCHEYPSN